jgi:hypothetical protein
MRAWPALRTGLLRAAGTDQQSPKERQLPQRSQIHSNAPPPVQRYCRSAAGARGSDATDAPVRLPRRIGQLGELRRQARSKNGEMMRYSWFHVLEVVQVLAWSVLSQIVGKVFKLRKLWGRFEKESFQPICVSWRDRLSRNESFYQRDQIVECHRGKLPNFVSSSSLPPP